MKLHFFQRPVHYIPAQQREGSLQDFREKIVSILLVSALTLGALAFIAAAFPAYRTHQYWVIGLFAVCYTWILIVTMQRSILSYSLKIYSISLIFYILGLTNLTQNGLSADAGVFLLSFIVVTSLMIGVRSGVFALILSISTFSLVGFLMSSGSLVPPILTDYREPLDWVSGGAVLILLSTLLLLSLNTILRGLSDSIAKARTLVVDTDRDREQLRLGSQDLQRRLAQLYAAADIEHSISAVLDPKGLMQKVVDLLGERFGLYHVGVFMLNENALPRENTGPGDDNTSSMSTASFAKAGAEVVFQAGTGAIVPEGYRLALSDSSNALRAMVNHKPRAADMSSKSDAFSAIYLPLAHTQLALPLLSHDRAMGVLMLHATQSNAFDTDDIAIFQSLADSLAIAVENARIFKQNQDDLEEIRSLQKQYLNRAWAETEQIHGNLSYTYEAGTEHRAGTEHKAGTEHQAQTTVPETKISTFSTPISLRDHVIGQFVLESDKPAWSNEDRAFIESVITEAALALDNARLLTETQRRADHDRLIADITRSVRTSTDIETILSSSIRELGRKLRASEAIISLNTGAEGDDQGQKGWAGEPNITSSENDHGEAGGENHPASGDDSMQQEVPA